MFLLCSNFSPELEAGQQGPAQDAVRLYPEPSPVQLIAWEIKVGADRIDHCHSRFVQLFVNSSTRSLLNTCFLPGLGLVRAVRVCGVSSRLSAVHHPASPSPVPPLAFTARAPSVCTGRYPSSVRVPPAACRPDSYFAHELKTQSQFAADSGTSNPAYDKLTASFLHL